MNNNIRVFAVIMLLLALAACSSIHAPPDQDIQSTLPENTLSYQVIDLKTSDVLASNAPDQLMVPASTIKVATTYAALAVLGPNHRFRTQVLVRGTLQGGRLNGDLILVGNGDPLLSAGDLRGLAIRVKDVGISEVNGQFLFYSDLPEFPEVNTGQPRDAAYNQGISGLNVLFNRAVQFQADRITLSPPEADGLTPISERSLTQRRAVPIDNPAKFTARLFHRFATIEGITLPKPQSGKPPHGSLILAEVQSQPLIEIARQGLEHSNNMVAEVLGLAVAGRLGLSVDDLGNSARGVGHWLERDIRGLTGFALNQANHSGLSAKTRISAQQMTTLLRHASNRRFDGWAFSALLPPGGGGQSLSARLNEPENAYRVWAKSGNMQYIKGLAGYIDAKSGRQLGFAIYTQNLARRDLRDLQTQQSANVEARAALIWQRSVAETEHELIETWMKRY